MARAAEHDDLKVQIERLFQHTDTPMKAGCTKAEGSSCGIHMPPEDDLFQVGSHLAAARLYWAKRCMDVGLSGIGILFSLPLWLLIAIAIELEGGGPVFYGQERVGEGCRRFWSWKFRSMIGDADVRFGPRQAEDGDFRITRVGRFLRATALDELPQLWNIFKGDMSFVGPRALMPTEIEINGSGEAVSIERIPGYPERHQVRPGLTGVAQVYAPRDVPRRYKFRYDLIYIRNQSLWLDLKLILLSFWITFRGKWESRAKKF